ncbi:MAG: hypothetical protein CMI54_00105 [Parcubacteria group bacterium]|nr:hypothetical protein [Parcubacteria group bacterium]|tara:strand:+ start:7463 stop:8698 length:1236 start_codon:yes stop_codon:yes gene_type:complete
MKVHKFINKILNKGTEIFNPQAKIIANVDRAIEFFETGNTAPVLLEVDPSNACNHGCYFCISSYIHLPESKDLETYDRSLMSRDMLMSLCQDSIDMNVRAINWTGGGEPTLNRHLKDAIEFIGTNSDIQMGMFTNGTLIDKHDMYDILVDNMTWVRFSIDAGTKETYNSIRRVRPGHNWDVMVSNLQTLINVNNSKGRKISIGVGFVVTPDTYKEVVDFATFFSKFDVDYCQFKPEIVNKEREGGVQRDLDFWSNQVEPRLKKAKDILGTKFQINGYKLTDLEEDLTLYGRNYKRCLGSQLQPCIGADGHVYVCTNHRGYKKYSYGSLHEKSFKDIWSDVQKRQSVMHQIDNVECFSNCTKLCKPHESNKIMWDLFDEYDNLCAKEKESFRTALLKGKKEIRGIIKHPDFI